LRGESLSGPPPRRIGIREVAQRAGVAISTVSKVFSGRGEVIPALRARVMEAADELGYQPNYVAQSLRRGATDLIGFAASDLTDPFSAAIVAGAESVLRPAGYALLVMSSGRVPDTDAANVRYLNSRRVDSILVVPTREDHPGLFAALQEFDGPVVAIESELDPRLSVDSVVADHRRGTIDAIDHLVDGGHHFIAALTGPAFRRAARERLAGLREGLRRHGLEDRALSIATEHDAGEAERAVLDLLAAPTPPSAILAGGMQLLLGALRAIRRRGLAVGEDIAVVGWDDVPLGEFLARPIAVVDRDPSGLGSAAARRALARLGRGGVRDDGPARAELLPARFVARPSAGPPRLPAISAGGS
jgi:LacI family transcriptional regulator